MRGPLPLNDSDFAEIRASVLERIATRRRAPWGELAALAASVVVAVVSAVMVRRPIVVRPVAHHVVVSVARRPPAPILRSAQDDRPVSHHRKRVRPTATVARIEIQTADPNIRIIWITNQEAP